MHHVGRQFEAGDMLLVIDHPGDLGGIETVLVHEDSARPHPGGDGIGAHADFLALEVVGLLDAGIRTHDEAAVVEAPHQENRQRNERSAERAGDHVGRGRHLADVEFDIAHHAAECADDGHDLDEVGLQPRNRDRAALDILGMAVGGDGNLQSRLRHCFSMPAFSITAAHFCTSAAMRSRISWGVLPRASMPSADAVAWSAGSASAALICPLRTASVSAGMPADEARPFQLVTTSVGKPLSFAVGTWRSSGLGSSPEVAMILTLLSEITAFSAA